MYKKNLKTIVMILMGIFMLFLLNTVSNAASFDASVSATNVKVGDTITVKVTANNAAGIYNVLADNSNVSKVSGETSEFLENGSATITYKAVSAGTTKITAKASDMTDLDDDTKAVTGSKLFTITIKSNENTSNNGGGSTTQAEPKKGTVTSCYINTVKVNEFLNVKNKDSVPVKVNTSTNEGLTIYNNKTKKSYKAKSGATTNVQIVEGEQTLTITLDTGYKTTRKVVSIKEGEEVKPNVMDENPEEEEVKVILKSLVIKGVTIVQLEGEEEPKEHKVSLELSPKFSSEVYEYSVTIPEELNDITKLDITALGDRDDFTIEINGNEDLVDGENIVTIIVKTKDGEKKQEYKIIVNKEPKTIETVATTELIEEAQPLEEEKPNTIIKNIIIVVTIIALVAGVVFAVVEYKYTSKPESAFEDVAYGTIEFEEEVNDNNDDFEEDIYENDNDEYEDRRQKRKGKHF